MGYCYRIKKTKNPNPNYAPPASVKRHEAEWVYDHWCEFKCSNCGNWSNSKPYKGKEKYCPECGAKMKNA
jgi:membrane protease subunit (stomatin/prohibitin family)